MTGQPELAMLWERTDPLAALADRFGFADPKQATAWLTDLLRRRWGIQVLTCERLMISAGNVLAWLTTQSGRMIAKCSVVTTGFARLAEVARLLAWLGNRGLPVSAPIPTLDGPHQTEADGKSIGLQRELLGSPLDATDPQQVTAAGASLADLHLALATYPATTRFSQPESEPPLSQRIADWLGSEAGSRRLAGTDQLRSRLQALGSSPEPSAQLVHNDFRSANILWHNGDISAILDFDETSLGSCVSDLANATVLLGTRYHNWAPVPLETQRAFVAGYQKTRPLSQPDAAWLETLVLWRTLRFIPTGDDPAGWARSATQLANERLAH